MSLYWEGSYFLFTIIVSAGIITLSGNFELDLTSHLLYKFSTVVSSILLHLSYVYGRRFILFLQKLCGTPNRYAVTLTFYQVRVRRIPGQYSFAYAICY